MTPDDAVTKLTSNLKVPVANAATFGATGPERPLWLAPDTYVMVWPTDNGCDVQVVSPTEESCSFLVAEIRKALGMRKSPAPAPEQAWDIRRFAWVSTLST